MNSPNAMAQPQQPPQQSQYFQRPSPATPNGMSPPAYPQPNAMRYPPPQPYTYPQYSQPPAPKRARLSPGPQSPYTTPSLAMTQSPGAGSPGNGPSVNGFTSASRPPGSMGPPSRPADRQQEDRNFDDILAGTGINIDEEDRRLTTFDSFGPTTPGSSFLSPQASFGSFGSGSQDRPGSSGRRDSGYGPSDHSGLPNVPQLTPEELQKRREVQADWQAARHAQHPLWRSFLFAETLHKRIAQQSYNEHLKTPQDGILRAQTNLAPQPTRVNGPDGASQIIDRGQTILQTGSGDSLRELLNVVCLAAKERLTGLVDLSARLSRERRLHSRGKVPNEWESMAAVAASNPAPDGVAASPTASTSLKRTHSQANAEPSTTPGSHRIADVFQRVSQADRAAEATRAAKRAKRSASTNPDAEQPAGAAVGGPDTPGGASQDSEKKITKKDRKAADMKFTEQQQHKSANETARMATQGVLGRGFGIGKGKKQYSWLAGGPAANSPTQTPTKTNSGSPSTSAAPTPGNVSAVATPKPKLFGQWDEDNDPGVQPRDVLLVLETDGKAPRTYAKGYSGVEA